MKTKFKKGDQVRVTKTQLRRWRKAEGSFDRVSIYSGKGEVREVWPGYVIARFNEQHAGFHPDMLEKA